MNENLTKGLQGGRGRLIFFLFVLVMGGLILFRMPRLATPLLISYVLYLVLVPLVDLLTKMRFHRTTATAIIFSGFIFFATYPVVNLIPTISTETKSFQYYIPKIETFLRKSYGQLKTVAKDKVGVDIDDRFLNDAIDYSKSGTKQALLNIPTVLASFLEWVFIVPLFLFFFLKDGTGFKRLLLKIAPNSIFEKFYHLFHQFNKQLGDYIFAKFIEASIVGAILTFGLLIMDVKFAFLLGLIAGITNIIPYVGPILGMIPGIIIGFAEYGTGTTTGAILILYLVANVIDLGIVFPILVSKIVDLHPIVVVVSVILGSQYMGILGMIICIPVAAALKLLLIELFREFSRGQVRSL